MTIRIIAVLIILTLIFVVIFFYFLNQNSKITELIVTRDPLNTAKSEKTFTDDGKDIYLLIKLNRVKKGEKVKVSWFKNEDDTGKTLVQDNNVITERQGSGLIKISLLNKNGSYGKGSYEVIVSLNENTEKSLYFSIR
jgi:hypothetical protein